MKNLAARRVIILGAQSAMAEAAARRFAADGARLVLVGRDAARLAEINDDLIVRGASAVHAVTLDFTQEPNPLARMHDFVDRIGGVSLILIAFGALGEQSLAENNLGHAKMLADVNFTSAMIWALAGASILEQQSAGTLMAIGSVAGDRGRKSNYVYGAAKAGLGVFMQGLAHRLAQAGDARAVLIKPGFVDTPMTAAFEKKGPLWASADQIAAIIHRAADRGGPIIYAPSFWRWIMIIIRSIPAALMHKTKL
ncbi:MAG: SDR family NAD(P)-dependent oxidoreductase [Hyphomonadaceae bacterium]